MSIVQYISTLILPVIIFVFALIILISKKEPMSAFYSGAKQGLKSSLELMPGLCLLVIGINMLSASGAVYHISKILDPVFNFLKIPVELLPLIITRPLSYGASIAAYEDLITKCGIDSFEVLCASIIMASSDTMLYVVGVYFSSTKVKSTRHLIPCAILVCIFSIFFSSVLSRLFFE